MPRAQCSIRHFEAIREGSRLNKKLRTFSAEEMAEYKRIRGTYENRIPEYRFAVDRAYHDGILAFDSPILDIGCSDPYEGLLQYLKRFSWGIRHIEAQKVFVPIPHLYTGIDLEVPTTALRQALKDEYEPRLLSGFDLDNFKYLPFPPTRKSPVKKFAIAFCIEVLEHMENQEHLIREMQRVAGTVFVIGPNAGFQGYYADVPGHVDILSRGKLLDWGFQKTGFVNWNGRPTKNEDPYPWRNGESETCSEVWGLWLDGIAQEMRRPASPYIRTTEYRATEDGIKISTKRELREKEPAPSGAEEEAQFLSTRRTEVAK